MKSVTERRLVWVAITCLFVFVLSPSLGVAETKTTVCKNCVRAVYKGELELHVEPAGTVLADPSVCLPKNQGAERYDYKGQLAKTVEKANTRMNAQILDQKIAGYGASVELLDRNIALLTGTIANLKELNGVTGYLLPIGAVTPTFYKGAKFKGWCYRAPDVKEFGHPDALGELSATFEKADLYAESSSGVDNALQKELPDKLKEFAALEKSNPSTKKEKNAKEARFAALADEVMAKVGNFMAIDPTVAEKQMPREFGGRGTRISSTPTILLEATRVPCTYDAAMGLVELDAKMYKITVNAVSFSHMFRKCMPEKQALAMLKGKLEEKRELLQEKRAEFVELLSDAGKELASLQKKKAQHFGD